MLSESMLVVRKLDVLRDIREDDFFECLSQRGEECNWSVGGAYCGVLVRFEHWDDFCSFPYHGDDVRVECYIVDPGEIADCTGSEVLEVAYVDVVWSG